MDISSDLTVSRNAIQKRSRYMCQHSSTLLNILGPWEAAPRRSEDRSSEIPGDYERKTAKVPAIAKPTSNIVLSLELRHTTKKVCRPYRI